jgi:hypothetical protein
MYQVKKAQSSIMEYLLLSLFILLVIIALVFFLTWWQSSQFGLEQQQLKNERIIVLMDRFINSPMFVKENSVFDDSRLMSVQSFRQEACTDLQKMFGADWFIEIEVLNSRPGCAGPCDASTYPCCGSWVICPQNKKNVSMVLPVNVYRKAEDRTDLGLLRVGVYS